MEFIRPSGFDTIINNLNILNEQYQNYEGLANQRLNFFVFPDKDLFEDIKRRAKELNEYLVSGNKSDLEIANIYLNLSDSLNYFLKQIKKSSFENNLFSTIIATVEELKNFRNKVNSIMHRVIGENESVNIIEEAIDMFQGDHNNSINFYDDSENDRNNINGLTNINSVVEDDEFIDEKCVKKDYLKIKNDFIYKSYYANILVKNENFNKESADFIKETFPECDLLFDFKKIQDELIIKQCKIEKAKLNFKYNFIIPNLNLNEKKEGEIYYPPYGWFGIGINVKNLYKINLREDIPKATAYYGFNNLKSKEIKQMLHFIMHKGFYINPDLQPKCRYFDKRKKDKYVGTGIYLTPKINIIEKNTGIVYFNEKAYKIALMVKVLADKIRQPDYDYWILRPNEIEIMRIIFKEIHFD